MCSQTRGDADWTKTHTVLPDTVRVNLRESKTEREIGLRKVTKTKTDLLK